MGKKVKEGRRFNNRARNQIDISVDQSETNKIKVDLTDVDVNKYDEANALVLPSKKRKTVKKLKAGTAREKFLSKKQRKKLEKIVERREKKSNRADLVTELQNYQLPAETYNALTPLVKVQTEGVRALSSNKQAVSSISRGKSVKNVKSGWKKSGAIVANKQKYLSWSRRFTASGDKLGKDPKVLGFDSESSSPSSEDEEVEMESESGIMVDQVENQVEDDIPQDKDQNVDEDVLSLNGEDDNNAAVDSAVVVAGGYIEGGEQEEEKRKRKFETTLGASKAGRILKRARAKAAEKNKESNDKTDPEETRQETIERQPEAKGKISDALTVDLKVDKKKVVHVTRSPEINNVRSKLPIIPEEQAVMEQITENIYVVLAGETGCGKTTQVPQFLYEAGYATDGKIIGVTEPRRVAAISMAARVAQELSLTSDEVSYQIRFDGTVSPKTQIKFMTDGVLLKEMGSDFLLKKYSVVCIDEAHERSLFTDILIGLLSRCVATRKKRGEPLKLVVMSATMRISDFMENTNLFKTKPGFVHIPARQFPVQMHFSRTTPENYIAAAVKKVIQIHKKLPRGGILVFVTGQQEVMTVIKNLKRLCPNTDKTKPDDSQGNSWKRKKKGANGRSLLRAVNLDEIKVSFSESGDKDDDDSEDSDLEEVNVDIDTTGLEPLHILPLYTMLPIAEQKKVFEHPPEGSRLCVVTTNVAETSLTIPSIRYVVDTGKVKDKLWDKVTGVQTFKVMWCSRASAEQRAGRAGRLGPGHCYRIFSSAVFHNEFQEYSTPEIKLRPVDDMVLLMKSMGIDQVKNFPYPTAPDDEQLTVAEELLMHLGALEPQSKKGVGRKAVGPSIISPLGKTMAQFPVGPRFAKMLAMSFTHSLTEYMVLLSAAFTVQEVLLEAGGDKQLEDKWTSVRKRWAGVGTSALLGDAKVLIKAAEAYELDGGSPEFCLKMGLRHKAMVEIRKLRKQLTNNVNVLVADRQEVDLNPRLPPPTDEQATMLRQIILSGSPDRIARKVQPEEISSGEEDPRKFKYAYKCGEMEDLVYIHSMSVLKKSQPSWLTYQDAFEINGKVYLRGVIAIEPEWILCLCSTLCRVDKPLKEPPPFYDPVEGQVKCHVKSTYGKQGWELPVTEIEHPSGVEKYSYFAQFLLEGDVFHKLKRWRDSLLSLPSTMTKSWAKLQPRTQSLLQGLASEGVDSNSMLLKAWEKDSKYLLKEYCEWVPERLHSDVRKAWPPVD